VFLVAAAPPHNPAHRGIELPLDLVVGQPIGTQQQEAGPPYLPLRQSLFADHRF